MSNYRIGDVIRMTRIYMGMSQEKLSEGICSVQTLHRIENGKTGVKRDLYIKLMKKMERIPEKNYAVCVGKDLELIDERNLFEKAVQIGDFQKAEPYFAKIKEKADGNIITKQYILKWEVLIDYYCKRSSAEETIKRLEEAIRLTVPDYKECLGKRFPFTEQEILNIMSLANAHIHADRDREAIVIYEKLLDCLNEDYIVGEYINHVRLVIMRNLAVAYSACEMYEKALKLNSECFKYAKENNEGIKIIELLGDKAWVISKQIKRGERKESDIDIVKQCLKQAYFLATVKRNMPYANIAKDAYREDFNEEISG